MNESFSGFDWDQGNRDKCRKHGVSVVEIESLFASEPAVRPDLHHSQAEQRFLAVGEGRRGRTVFLVFTIRERDGRRLIRPSAPATCTGRRLSVMPKKIPDFKTDEEAEQFVETADLTEYDLSGFVPTRFEFAAKSAQLNMRVPGALLDAVKARARARGIPYTRYIRQLMEQDVTRSPKPGAGPAHRG